MHPATLHGVGVITKLYFAIFAAFKESLSLNLDRSAVIQGYAFWRQSKARVRLITASLSNSFHDITT